MSTNVNNILGEMGFDSSLYNTLDSQLTSYVPRKYYYIYITINLLNKRQYVGVHSTDNLKDGYLGSGKLILEDINKIGKENFSNEILEFCTILNWKEKEIYWIKKKKSHINEGGYNLTLGGEGVIGFPPWNKGLINCYSEETKKKWSNIRKGKKLSTEAKIKLSKFNKGKIVSEETKKKQSISHMGNKNPMYGKPIWDPINKIKKTCEYCGIITNPGNYKRWHGEKCKYKI